MKTSFIITGDASRPDIGRAMRETSAWLSEVADVLAVDETRTLPLCDYDADYVVVFGGDGSILGAVQRLRGKPTPVVGINFGKFGYLAEFEWAETRTCLEAIIKGDIKPSSRMLLECTSSRCDEKDGPLFAVNEIAVARQEPGHMVDVGLQINDSDTTRFLGDGVMIATPVGSTAYNLSAGGPVLHPRLEVMTITPICAHLLTMRSLVIPAGEEVRLTVFSDTKSTLLIDGKNACELSAGDTVEVYKSQRSFLLVETPDRTYYQTLITKLKWGEQPKYAEG